MKLIRIAVLFLALMISFAVYAQNSRSTRHRPRTIEGTVVDKREGPSWLAIVIESGGRRYMVTTAYNPNSLGRDPVMVGDVESIGARVRVTYIGSEPWEANMPALYATRVVRLTNQIVSPRGNIPTSVAQSNLVLPAKIRSYLNKHYSGWRLISVASNCFPDYNRAVVTGDFDGDRKPDYTVKIIRGGKGHFIGFLERAISYEAHVLLSTSASAIKTFGMTIGKKGERYSIGDYEDRRYGRLPNDAPVIGACESEACPMVYRNGKFNCD